MLVNGEIDTADLRAEKDAQRAEKLLAFQRQASPEAAARVGLAALGAMVADGGLTETQARALVWRRLREIERRAV